MGRRKEGRKGAASITVRTVSDALTMPWQYSVYTPYQRHTEDDWHMDHEEDKVDQIAFPAPEGQWG